MKPLPILAALAASVFAVDASAQDSSAEWDMSCEAKRCTILRTATQENSGRRVASLLVVVDADNPDTPGIGVALPLGSALEPGVRLLFGDQSINLPFQVCLPDGCRALRASTPEEIELLSTERETELRFFPFGKDKPLSVTLPLRGFEDALSDARKRVAGG